MTLKARPEEGEGIAMGDVVNTASRLQQAAHIGRVVVGEVTYRATKGLVDYEELEPVTVKGKGKPIPHMARDRCRQPVPRRRRAGEAYSVHRPGTRAGAPQADLREDSRGVGYAAHHDHRRLLDKHASADALRDELRALVAFVDPPAPARS